MPLGPNQVSKISIENVGFSHSQNTHNKTVVSADDPLLLALRSLDLRATSALGSDFEALFELQNRTPSKTP